MTLRDEIQAIVEGVPAVLEERKGVFRFTYVVAERKTFLCRQKLVYSACLRVDDASKELLFSEMLKEKGFGLGAGSVDDDMSPGAGYKKSTYSFGLGPREETLEEHSTLFGRKYSYIFDFSQIRERIRSAATAAGYSFVYKLIL